MNARADREVLAAVAGARAGRSGWRRGNCPFCLGREGKADRKRSLGLAADGRWHCFRCSAEGWVSDPHAPPLAVDAGSPGPADLGPPAGFHELFEGPGARALSLDEARAYLLRPAREGGRGLDREVLREAGVGACASGRLAGRVVVPVLDEEGGWRGWSSRPWAGPAAYLTATGMDRASTIYNPGALRSRRSGPALGVEGVFDALALWPDGFAFLGKPSDGQVALLLAAPRDVVLVPDGDAWREGDALVMMLRFQGKRAGLVRLPPKADPDEMPATVRAAARRSLDTEREEIAA